MAAGALVQVQGAHIHLGGHGGEGGEPEGQARVVVEQKGDKARPLPGLADETHRVEEGEPLLHARHGTLVVGTTAAAAAATVFVVDPAAVGASVGGEV